MALYMYQASYTAKSMAAQIQEPQDPVEAISAALEDVGAKIVVAAFPFGGHPTLGDYLRWAQSVGCTVQSSYGRTADGEMVLVTRIEAPDGRWVVEVGTEQNTSPRRR